MDQLLLRGQELVRLPYSGPSLGMLEEPRIEKRELEFRAGDRLLLFTDGITETFNGAGEHFGEERIAGVLHGSRDVAVAALLDRLVRAMHAFRDTRRPHDDVTIVAIDPC
jgi:sigma-B regulation protein RsbU (phosphoserine phosphatase)